MHRDKSTIFATTEPQRKWWEIEHSDGRSPGADLTSFHPIRLRLKRRLLWFHFNGKGSQVSTYEKSSRKGKGPTWQSVAHSPDGRHIISGSCDTTIRIWDAETGASVGKPLKRHIHTKFVHWWCSWSASKRACFINACNIVYFSFVDVSQLYC